MARAIITQKSPERKFARGSGRFITAQDEQDPTKGYSFLLFPNSSGEYQQVFTYNVIELSGDEEPKSPTKYDVNMDGDVFKEMFFVKKPRFSVIGRAFEQKEVDVPLSMVTFYHEYLQDSVYNVIINAKDIGFNYFPSSMTGLQLDGHVKVSGRFELSLRRATLPDGKAEWKRAYKFIDGTLNMDRSDLSAITPHVREAVMDADKERALGILLRELKANGTYLDIYNARLTLRANGIDDAVFKDSEIESVLNSATFKKDYNPEYFHALKKAQEKGVGILYSESGFVFRVNGRWVWEVPKPSTATYMFDGRKPVEELRAILSKVQRIDILKVVGVQEESMYIGRAIHPPEDENGQGISRWLSDVMHGTGVKHKVIDT